MEHSFCSKNTRQRGKILKISRELQAKTNKKFRLTSRLSLIFWIGKYYRFTIFKLLDK